jgi:hypothetical protein
VTSWQCRTSALVLLLRSLLVDQGFAIVHAHVSKLNLENPIGTTHPYDVGTFRVCRSDAQPVSVEPRATLNERRTPWKFLHRRSLPYGGQSVEQS